MALVPYFLDGLRPRRVRNSLFGFDLADELLTDVFDRPSLSLRQYVRPLKNLSALARDIGTTIKSDKDKFQVNIDVQHFDPEEVSVKTADGFIEVEGKHEERKDEHGFISRHFKRRYALPEGCNPETVESRLSSDGVLSVICPKKSLGLKDERAIPITHTGPVRRKLQDDEENGEVIEEQTKTPQKKRRHIKQ